MKKATCLIFFLALAGACGTSGAGEPVLLTAAQMDRISAGQNGDIVVGGVDSVDFTERLNTVFAELQMFRAIGFFNQLTSGVGNFSASSAFSSLSQNIAGFSISLSPGGGSSSLTLNPGRR